MDNCYDKNDKVIAKCLDCRHSYTSESDWHRRVHCDKECQNFDCFEERYFANNKMKHEELAIEDEIKIVSREKLKTRIIAKATAFAAWKETFTNMPFKLFYNVWLKKMAKYYGVDSFWRKEDFMPEENEDIMLDFNYEQVLLEDDEFSINEVFSVALCRLINPDIKIIRAKKSDFSKHIENAHRLKPPERILTLDSSMNFCRLYDDYGHNVWTNKKQFGYVRDNFVEPMMNMIANKKTDVMYASFHNLNYSKGYPNSDVPFMRAVNIAQIILQGWLDICMR